MVSRRYKEGMHVVRPLLFSLCGLLFGLLLGSCQSTSSALGKSPGALLCGPMLADLTPTHVRIWAEAAKPVVYSLQIRSLEPTTNWRDAVGDFSRTGQLRLDQAGKRGFATVAHLQPNTRYEYRLLDKNRRVLPDLHGQTFRTPPSDGTPYDFKLAFGSCAGEWGIDPTQPIFTAIDHLRPDLFLWLGDNVYFIRPQREWENPQLMENRYRRSRAMPSLQSLLAHTAHYAIWDDHDFGPDDSDSTYPLRDVSKQLFAAYWPNPAVGLSKDDGIFFKFTVGRVEFFMLDTRYERTPNDAPDGPDKVILGGGQWLWLEQGLKESQADFKVVASGMQILSNYHRFETWNLFPQQRARLLEFLREEKIGGVFFISGDRHIGEALREPQKNSYDMVEFTSSPLAAGIGETRPDAEVPQRIAGTLAAAENFAMLEFHFPAVGATDYHEGPVLTFRLHDVYGKPLGRQVVLRLSELQP